MTMKDKSNLIWIDLEMTGLDPEKERIIEIATVVTDSELNVLAEGPSLAINQSEQLLHAMDEWNTNQHGKSVVNFNLFCLMFLSNNTSRCGSYIGTIPLCILSTFAASMSTQITSLPVSAKQVPVTNPT